MIPLLRVELRREQDVVLARQRAREVAGLLGFEEQDCSRIATAVSEIARNAHTYAGGGKVEFAVGGTPAALEIAVRDQGTGIQNVEAILAGRYRSSTGMGLGIIGAQRLMDGFTLDTAPRGTRVVMRKNLPPGKMVPGPLELERIGRELARSANDDPYLQLQQQNHELTQALLALRQREGDLGELNRELEETNRGVVALYAELETRAEQLRRASELKSRFLSNMSHEFRTPLGSIISIAELLLGRIDGELTSEQEKQVKLIHGSARELAQLVNDLLDLAKVEAGRVDVRVDTFGVDDLFNSLRAVLRPLAHNPELALVFESAELPQLQTDEGKVGQILRNFISNALKFTERGEVRVSARRGPGDTMVFDVRDTGIGIAAADQARIFEEFTQVENPLQRHVKGTGLGLPLTQRLAELLGGTVAVKSALGQGSTFSLILPRICQPQSQPREQHPLTVPRLDKIAASRVVLVVDDEEAPRYVLRSNLGEHYRLVEADNAEAGLASARAEAPALIFLDLSMPGRDGAELLAELRRDPSTAEIPVALFTSRELDDATRTRFRAQGVVSFVGKLHDSREALRTELSSALQAAGLEPLEVRAVEAGHA